MQTLFRCLLSLYPAAFCQEFGDEMMWVFSQTLSDARQQAFRSRALFFSREIVGLLAGAMHQRLGGWNFTRRLDMRSFRFPRSFILLMLVILFTVFIAIDTARQALSPAPHGGASWLPLGMIGLFLFVMLVMGLIGYAVLLFIKRSGVERLSNIRPWVRTK